MKLKKKVLLVLAMCLVFGQANSFASELDVKSDKVIQDTSNKESTTESSLVRREGTEGLVGKSIFVFDSSRALKEGDSLVYLNPDGKEVEFKASKLKIDGSIQFEIIPNLRGEWKAIKFNGKEIKNDLISFFAYKDIKDIYVTNKYELPWFLKNEDKVVRIADKDRYSTAIEISKRMYDKADKVLLASGENFADALFAGPLAMHYQAPMLLIDKDGKNEEVFKEIERLGAKNLYIIGGEKTLSKELEEKLSKMDLKLERFSGKDRFQTASYLSSNYSKSVGYPYQGDSALVVNGYEFADALSSAPYLAQVRKNGHLIGFFPAWQGDKPACIIVGGEKSVTLKSVEYRIAGTDRYDTAIEVAKAYDSKLNDKRDKVVLVDGTNYPDALTAGVLADKIGASVLLTNPKELYPGVKAYIKEAGIKEVLIVGGESSISPAIEKELKELIAN